MNCGGSIEMDTGIIHACIHRQCGRPVPLATLGPDRSLAVGRSFIIRPHELEAGTGTQARIGTFRLFRLTPRPRPAPTCKPRTP